MAVAIILLFTVALAALAGWAAGYSQGLHEPSIRMIWERRLAAAAVREAQAEHALQMALQRGDREEAERALAEANAAIRDENALEEALNPPAVKLPMGDF